MIVDRVLSRLDSVTQNGSGWTARCPAHDDKKPSLSVDVSESGKILVNCHAGCKCKDVVGAIGLSERDLFPSENGARKKPRPAFPSFEAAVGYMKTPASGKWTYRNAGGSEAFHVVRFELSPDSGNKDFRPYYQTAEGWVSGYPSDPRPLYGLPTLKNAHRVYVTEGEKSAEAGRTLGLVTTTSAGGSSAAKHTDWSPLAGKDVVILPDNDQAGEKYAADVKRLLGELQPAPLVRVVNLDVPEKGDLVEWLEARDAKPTEDIAEELEELVNKTPLEQLTFFRATQKLGDLHSEIPSAAIEGLLYERTFTIMGGDPKSGKSMLSLQLALGVVTGKPVLGFEIAKRGPAVLLQADMGEGYFGHVVKQLARGMGIDLNAELPHPIHHVCRTGIDLQDAKIRSVLLAEISKLKPAIVVLDPLRDIHSGNENASEELKNPLDFCLELRNQLGTLVILIDHVVKPSAKSVSRPAGYALRGSGSKFGRADSVLVVRDVGGKSEVSGQHRYGPAPEMFWFRIADEDETGGGLHLVLDDPPDENAVSQDRMPQGRLQAYAESNPDQWLSQADFRRGCKIGAVAVKREIPNLVARNVLEDNGKIFPNRRWRLLPVQLSVQLDR